MRYSRLLLLALALALAACGSDSRGGPQLRPEDYALVKVSGDQQSDTVLLSSASQQVATVAGAGVRGLTTPEGQQFLPQPLVVKVVPQAGASLDRVPLGASADLGPTGPDLQAAGILPTVTWHVVEDGCGEAWTAAEQPDADSLAATFVVPGTTAGDCTVRAQTVKRDSAGNLVPVTEAEFHYTLLPGPLSRFDLKLPGNAVSQYVAVGDTIDLRAYLANARDEHGNVIADSTVAALPDSLVHSGWSSRVCDPQCPPIADYAHADATGWRVVVPDTAGYHLSYDGTYALRLVTYVDGVLDQTDYPAAHELAFTVRP